MEHFKYLLSLGLLLILAPGFSQIKYDSVLNNGVKRKIKISNTLTNAEISAQNILFRKTLQEQLRATEPLSALRQTEYITGVIDLEISTAGPACGYSNGKIQVTPKSGTSPFRYSIDGASFVAIGYFPVP